MKSLDAIDAEDAVEMFENVKQLLFEETMAGLTKEQIMSRSFLPGQDDLIDEAASDLAAEPRGDSADGKTAAVENLEQSVNPIDQT